MAYTALYRKWRPARFEDVRGQEHIVRTLKNQIISDRVGHAYLFCGTRGTGKTTIAKIMARAVNCEHPVDGSPCNECAVCRSILEGRSVNVAEIDAASNNGVDNIREIRDQVQYSPTEGKYRVYIIDEVHMLSAGAFNALLKTLEEPPAYVIFILATTEANKIPITVLSRCQRYDFRRIGNNVIADQVSNLLKAEGVEAELTEKGFDKAVIAEFMKLLSNAPFTLDYVKEICKNSEYVDSLAYIIDTSNALADGKYVAEYDMTLVRGQGYYTGTVFEVESLDFNSSIAGGGRYDNLIGKFLKEQIPAVGFSIGFERIYSILMEKESYNTEKQKKVVLIYEEDQVADAIRYAEELRKTYKTALYIKPKKLGKFLNKLEEQGFDGFQVFGRDEEVRMFGEQ